jgi:hypothetical protein
VTTVEATLYSEVDVDSTLQNYSQEHIPTGRVAAIDGVVLDIDFPPGQLPAISHALVVQRSPLPPFSPVTAARDPSYEL